MFHLVRLYFEASDNTCHVDQSGQMMLHNGREKNSKYVSCVKKETPHHNPAGCVSGHALEVKILPVKLKATGMLQ